MLLAENPSDTGNEDYRVGHGKPPLETQFGKPNGNPINLSGKPKGARSLKSVVRKRLRDRGQAEALADNLIDLALAHDAKVTEILALGNFHDEGMQEATETVDPAAQRHTPEQRTKALIAALRASGHEDEAKSLEEKASE